MTRNEIEEDGNFMVSMQQFSDFRIETIWAGTVVGACAADYGEGGHPEDPGEFEIDHLDGFGILEADGSVLGTEQEISDSGMLKLQEAVLELVDRELDVSDIKLADICPQIVEALY